MPFDKDNKKLNQNKVRLSTFDAKIISEFLEANYEAFQNHLEEKEIEGSEAELILNTLQNEI